MEIYRTQPELATLFSAPQNVTFGWQPARHAASVWYKSDDVHDTTYVIVGTGQPFSLVPLGYSTWELVGTVTLPEDGLTTIHLLRAVR